MKLFTTILFTLLQDEEKKKPKKVTIKELVDSDMIHVDGLDPSKESIQLSKTK